MKWERWRQELHLNAPFILSTLAAAGIVLLSLLPRFSGTAAWVLRVLAIVLATFGPIATQLETRRADEAKRLDVTMAVRQKLLAPFPANDRFLEEWLVHEETACLMSVEHYERPDPEPSHSTGFDVSQLRGPTFNELLDLEQKEAQGEELTPEQQQALSEGRQAMAGINKAMAQAFKGFASTVNFFVPEDRSPEQYRDEVVAYLDSSAGHRIAPPFPGVRCCTVRTDPAGTGQFNGPPVRKRHR